MDPAPPLPPLPSRPADGHKGVFGTVGVIGGRADDQAHMLGGPCFSAIAALRTGCGLARLALPAPILDAGLALAPGATGVPIPTGADGEILGSGASEVVDRLAAECSCLAIGPGLGDGAGAQVASLRAVWQAECPVVVDADALNCLSQTPELQRDFHAQAILTPHPGEFRRLADLLGVGESATEDGQRDRAAAHLAQRLGCVVVLKGAPAIVSDGQRTWRNDDEPDLAQNAALATAGTGDVLTGCIASIVAQCYRRPLSAGSRTVTSERRGGLSLFDCARLGVRAHALAARAWAHHRRATGGMLATELADLLPEACQRLRAPGA
jgi:NAD(P)H-hydrate epimerase